MESLISRTDQVEVRTSGSGKVDKLDQLVKENITSRTSRTGNGKLWNTTERPDLRITWVEGGEPGPKAQKTFSAKS